MPLNRSLAVMVILTVAASGSVLAQAHEHKQGPLTVVHPWSRATAPSQKAGGVFLRIRNDSNQPDRLIGVESDRADVASLHALIRDGDVMRMRPVQGGIEVPANGEVVLAPGGKHVMLIGLRAQLIKESNIPLTLIFERAGRVEIVAVVEAAGSRGPSGAGAHRAADTKSR
ncbi:MAG: copper chaperone PCu(A)C [Alphaproteobacteria bacterium]|nr:copper chaperone PCu(A)C [Alphaproteobacteria bacterium]MCZ6591588.1 copper chaperone PCu(A)C [Alphaproteobacteria bacterium]MCZ6839736.1 copper chaperone PCu(A)C [Alphaproteobacteria bacterium]MCZ6846244.1 copper chaperone PCu(A)C [Alphaproteobacteria bacterium]